MKKIYSILAALLLCGSLSAQDTFSIIAVDPATGEVGSAGASCVSGVGSGGIIDIITDIIPGKGGVNSQAWVCIPNTNLQNAILRMEEGLSPQEIIDWLLLNDSCSSQNFDPAFRQYGIVDLDGGGSPRTAGWTGNMADDYKEDRQGSNFSVQGNILLDVTVIDNMEANFNNTSGTLADKLMAAMQGANFAGADARCLADGTSSTTAYLMVYRADDDPNDPYLRLNVGQQAAGIEPIDLLQDLYDDFLAVEDVALNNKLRLFPNPAANELTLDVDPSIALTGLSIYDINGKNVFSQTEFGVQQQQQRIQIAQLPSGVFFLTIESKQGTTTIKFVKQ
ncbi:MAG: DUF1028 domain-containing protein [Bacteroidota bacterium]